MLENSELNFLLSKNKKFADEYRSSLIMKLIRSDRLSKKETRNRLLDCIQTFSNYFQKVVILRHALCENPQFLPITQQHLAEEFGHDQSLMADRKHKPPMWDPILEATASWFSWKMLTLDSEEKTVLVHLVLETSANIFFHEAHRVMQVYNETKYFQIHSELDEQHENLGKGLLVNLTSSKYERLLEIQHQGWGVLNALCDRIESLTTVQP